MKKTLLLLLLFSTLAKAQETEIKVTPEGITSLVVSTEGFSATQLYDKSKMLVLKMFSNPKYVIKVDEAGKILRFNGYQVFKEGFSSSGTYNYTCQLEFKDDRYKISFYDVYLDKAGHVTCRDLFNKDGEIRHYDYYKNIYSNFIAMLNGVNHLIKDSVSKKSDEDKW
jgi:hypothetical protein